MIALWTVPRSASTAFERMMLERGDVTVFHEPFSVAYYYGPEKRSTRYAEVKEHSDAREIAEGLRAAADDRPVFVKDMAYHVADLLDPATLDDCTHTFLVRDPAWTVPSLAAMWPDFTLEEAGFDALDRMVAAVEARGEAPVVVDSDDLRRDPARVVRAYCEHVGLPFRADALNWDAGMRPEWGLWSDWHTDVAATEGFLPPPTGAPAPIGDARVAAAYERCREVYERLVSLRL